MSVRVLVRARVCATVCVRVQGARGRRAGARFGWSMLRFIWADEPVRPDAERHATRGGTHSQAPRRHRLTPCCTLSSGRAPSQRNTSSEHVPQPCECAIRTRNPFAHTAHDAAGAIRYPFSVGPVQAVQLFRRDAGLPMDGAERAACACHGLGQGLRCGTLRCRVRSPSTVRDRVLHYSVVRCHCTELQSSDR